MKSKSERFRDLATKRVNRAIKDLRLIGNLSNRKNYDYTQEDARKIIKALETEMRGIKTLFENSPREEEVEFKL